MINQMKTSNKKKKRGKKSMSVMKARVGEKGSARACFSPETKWGGGTRDVEHTRNRKDPEEN